MSLDSYNKAREIFLQYGNIEAFLMAAVMKADPVNLHNLKMCWPQLVAEVYQRYDAPGGVLSNEQPRPPQPGKPKIYAWINWHDGADDYSVCAMSEDGYLLSGHLSSSESWAQHDIGVTSNWKHEIYDERYPDGWDLEWVPPSDVLTHSGLQSAYAINQAMKKEQESEEEW